jgi:hypothetical protein|tara:strand:- start:381 stop:722 length:342 start_codon:yes stop_codon:yes gene_type:complete
LIEIIRNRLGWVVFSVMFVFGVVWMPSVADAAPDPRFVAGPKACGECHKAAAEFWRKTKHYSGFRKLTQRKEARRIVKRMKIRWSALVDARIKSGHDNRACIRSLGLSQAALA